jgi:2-(1,2-epoxy-1,2-dihydrophenyl)acetyl-CoA isomerase
MEKHAKESGMKSLETVDFEEKDGVGWIRMNRPKELNAFNIAMGRDLCKVANHCAAETSIRAVVLTGKGRAFCAGGDVKDMNRHLQEVGRADLFLRELTVHLHSFVSEIVRMPKPVLAAVNGTAAGAGMSMSLACDLGIAVEGCRFVMAYTNIGLVPDGSATYFLSRLVGYRKAMEIVYLNRPMDSEEALKLGLVNQVFPAEIFEEEVASLAARLAVGPTATYGRAKNLVRLGLTESLESQMENERQGISMSALSEEFQEGIAAFVGKRKPDFTKAAIEK